MVRGPDAVAAYLHDAARTPGGHAAEVALPASEAEVAFALAQPGTLLPIGAQSSVTGGATPFGERVLSTARLDTLGPVRGERVRVGAGVALLTLEAALAPHGLFYPPATTYTGAFLGGTVATNAAGAATFKYGSTRRWVEALTVVLAGGDVLDLERGAVRAHPEGFFEVELVSGELRRVPLPGYRMPDVAKRSAGYHAEPEMDLLDLFVGCEGTLGVVTEVELRLRPAPERLLAWAAFASEAAALATVAELRAAARATWRSGDPRGIDVAAIESLDRRCLELLREDGRLREAGVRLPRDADTAVLIQAELPRGSGGERVLDELGRLDEAEAPDTPLVRLGRLLAAAGVLDSLELALPGDRPRAERLVALREAVPLGVSQRIEKWQRELDPRVRKTATDMIVPFERLGEMLGVYRAGLAALGLDHAIWGHVSDGNLHVNVLPRAAAEVAAAEAVFLGFGDACVRFGGCPLAEHGVGRGRLKQQLLRRLYGDEGLAQMRAVKAALDPEWKLAPGVLFPPPGVDSATLAPPC